MFSCLAVHVSDGALELGARKCIFLAYAHRVNGYKQWCTKKHAPIFMSSRVFIFDESTLLHKRSEKSILKKDLNGVLETGGASGRE